MGHLSLIPRSAALGILVLVLAKPAFADEPVQFNFIEEQQEGPLTLHVQDDWVVADGLLEPKWKPVCSSPCSSSLPPGTYRFALSTDDQPTLEVEGRVQLTRPSVLRGSYKSNSGIRMAGYITMFGVPALMLLSNMGTESCDADDCSGSDDHTGSYIRLGVGVVGFFAGLVMTMVDDKAWITVSPLTTQGDSAAADMDRLGPLGLAVTLRPL